VLYTFSLLLILRINSWLSLWARLELNLFRFIITFYNYRKIVERVVDYYIIQTGFRVLILARFFFWGREKIFATVLLVKRAMPPFHFWALKILSSATKKFLFAMWFLQKAPLFVILANYRIFIALPFLVRVLGFSVLHRIFTKRGLFLILFSSLTQSGWILIFLCLDFTLMWTFMLLYYLVRAYLFYLLASNNIIRSVVVWTILIGIPPFFFFYVKWVVLVFIKTGLWLLFISARLIFVYLYFKQIVLSSFLYWGKIQNASRGVRAGILFLRIVLTG